MDRLIIKKETVNQEKVTVEHNNVDMDSEFTALGDGASGQITELDDIEFELDDFHSGRSDSFGSNSTGILAAAASAPGRSQQPVVTLTSQPQQRQTSQVKLVSLANPTSLSQARMPGHQQGGQVVFATSIGDRSSATTDLSRSLQQSHLGSVLASAGSVSIKRSASGANTTLQGGQQVFHKVIIANNPGTTQQQILPAGSLLAHGTTAGGHSFQQSIIGQPGIAEGAMPRTPTKGITLIPGGVTSPRKILTVRQRTPTKQIIPTGKVPISPARTPPKVTMLPMTGKSPQKIAPAGGQFVMLTKPGSGAVVVSTVASASARSSAISMSPSKVIIKGQTVTVPSGHGTPQSVVVSQARTSTAVSLSNLPSNVQPLSVSGNKFQYVRLVTTPATHSSQTTQVSKSTSMSHSIAPAPTRTLVSTASAPLKLAVPHNSHQQMVSKTSQPLSQQRLILPATSQVLQQPLSLPGQAHQQVGAAQLRAPNPNMQPGSTINLQTVQGFALIPAQYVAQLQQSQVPSASLLPPPSHKQQQQQQPYPAIATNTLSSSSSAVSSGRQTAVNGSSGRQAVPAEPPGQRPRKPCNCTKSQCLKLYCDCFANGEFCNNCNCNNCYNNLDHEEERQRAIKSCLERNPHAFHPKIGKGSRSDGIRMHSKGCNCKRSGCLKNYCECYEAKILCSNLCKCVGCKNFEESPDRKTLMHLADAAEVRVQQQTAAKTKLSSHIQDLPTRAQPPPSGEKPPYTFVTSDVAEAVCACLVAQAEEAERTRQSEMGEECLILQEFGRCLIQVIQSASRTKAASPVP